MTNWTRYDPELERFVPCGGRLVACAMGDCENRGLDIEVPDDPLGAVLCGACNCWIVAPEGAEDGTPIEVPELGGLEPVDEAQT